MQRDESTPSVEITALLRDWQTGDRDALDRMIPLVYRELHVMASRLMSREWRDGTIQTTGLVGGAYLKLVDQRQVDWQGPPHFFPVPAPGMRPILLDAAPRRVRGKRGGGAAPLV